MFKGEGNAESFRLVQRGNWYSWFYWYFLVAYFFPLLERWIMSTCKLIKQYMSICNYRYLYSYVNPKLIYVYMQHTCNDNFFNKIKLHVIVNIIMMHVDMNSMHAMYCWHNFTLIYVTCRGQKYSNLVF